MKVWIFPIEPFEQRYTSLWYRLFSTRFAAEVSGAVEMVDGEPLSQGIETGQWLDVFGTHHYKATQLARFSGYLRDGRVSPSDCVLLLDGWNPAVVQLAYMRDVARVPFKMVGLFHAGTWDPWDLLSQSGCGRWANDFERSLFKTLDCACVATEFHRELIQQAVGPCRIEVTGFPLEVDQTFACEWSQRPNRVIFPHRLAPEKQPDVFADLAAAYRATYPDMDVLFERTFDAGTANDKTLYYRLLGTSKASFSSALQETWGIAMIESMLLGAYPIAPDRLSYRETVGGQRYKTLAEAVAMIHDAVTASSAYPYPADQQARLSSAMTQIARVCCHGQYQA